MKMFQAKEKEVLRTLEGEFRAVKDIVQNPSCNYWHIPVCQKLQVRNGMQKWQMMLFSAS